MIGVFFYLWHIASSRCFMWNTNFGTHSKIPVQHGWNKDHWRSMQHYHSIAPQHSIALALLKADLWERKEYTYIPSLLIWTLIRFYIMNTKIKKANCLGFLITETVCSEPHAYSLQKFTLNSQSWDKSGRDTGAWFTCILIMSTTQCTHSSESLN